MFMEPSKWTVGTMLIAVILLALFINTIADILGWSLATPINATSSFYASSIQAIDNTTPEVAYVGKAGNYTYIVYHTSGSSTLDKMIYYVTILISGLIYILSYPPTLLLVLGVTLIIVALEMRKRGL